MANVSESKHAHKAGNSGEIIEKERKGRKAELLASMTQFFLRISNSISDLDAMVRYANTN